MIDGNLANLEGTLITVALHVQVSNIILVWNQSSLLQDVAPFSRTQSQAIVKAAQDWKLVFELVLAELVEKVKSLRGMSFLSEILGG